MAVPSAAAETSQNSTSRPVVAPPLTAEEEGALLVISFAK
jgi:hypothetical protein